MLLPPGAESFLSTGELSTSSSSLSSSPPPSAFSAFGMDALPNPRFERPLFPPWPEASKRAAELLFGPLNPLLPLLFADLLLGGASGLLLLLLPLPPPSFLESSAAAAAEDSKKLGGGKGSNSSSKPEAPPRSKSAKSRGSNGFKGPKSSSAALFEASGHGGKGGLSKRGLGSASIPKALNALGGGEDDSDEEDVESSPVERKDSAPGGSSM